MPAMAIMSAVFSATSRSTALTGADSTRRRAVECLVEVQEREPESEREPAPTASEPEWFSGVVL